MILKLLLFASFCLAGMLGGENDQIGFQAGSLNQFKATENMETVYTGHQYTSSDRSINTPDSPPNHPPHQSPQKNIENESSQHDKTYFPDGSIKTPVSPQNHPRHRSPKKNMENKSSQRDKPNFSDRSIKKPDSRLFSQPQRSTSDATIQSGTRPKSVVGQSQGKQKKKGDGKKIIPIRLADVITISPNLKIKLSNFYFISPHIMSLDFKCVDTKISCTIILKNMGFRAFSANKEFVKLQIAYGNKCLGNHLNPEKVLYSGLRLEYPASQVHDLELSSFLNVDYIVYDEYISPNVNAVKKLPVDYAAKLQISLKEHNKINAALNSGHSFTLCSLEDIDYSLPDYKTRCSNIVPISPVNQTQIHPKYNLSGRNTIGSVIAPSCPEGYTVYPYFASIECKNIPPMGITSWFPNALPSCVKSQPTCEDFCNNGAKCRFEEGKKIPTCTCSPKYVGYRCEYDSRLYKSDPSEGLAKQDPFKYQRNKNLCPDHINYPLFDPPGHSPSQIRPKIEIPKNRTIRSKIDLSCPVNYEVYPKGFVLKCARISESFLGWKPKLSKGEIPPGGPFCIEVGRICDEGFCKNEGKCVFDTKKGHPECKCQGDFIGFHCEFRLGEIPLINFASQWKVICNLPIISGGHLRPLADPLKGNILRVGEEARFVCDKGTDEPVKFAKCLATGKLDVKNPNDICAPIPYLQTNTRKGRRNYIAARQSSFLNISNSGAVSLYSILALVCVLMLTTFISVILRQFCFKRK